jgi:hypothetical protein
MNKEEKQMLLKYLCAILPYGVKYCREYWDYERDQEMCAVGTLESIDKDGYINDTKVYTVWDIKPYLRPMSSMTEEEYEEFCKTDKLMATLLEINKLGIQGTRECHLMVAKALGERVTEQQNWLNSHHFDYRGLIEKGLALEAPEGSYNTKTE